ncbi:unnamed protein product [Moneuplotes crassus]|uniref:Uncharacterized protein n=1 Tax=Euplotes crassus TaxID=5936 RepID=A0AAD2D6W8_EUPCR|nr:unnamed protein product [Moneuplotes crassus]
MKYSNAIHGEFHSIADVFQNRSNKIRPKIKIKDLDEIEVKTKHTAGEELVDKSLIFLSKKNFIRKLCIKIIYWKPFDWFIISLIVINSLMLGMMDYTDENNTSWRNKIVNKSEPIFIVLFTLECIIKVIAMGFIGGKGTYLRDSWNWLDFVVVITSLLSLLPSFSNYSSIRTFRLFRPLRSLTSLGSMKLLIGTLLSSVVGLGEILIFAFFFLLIFAILGISLWAGEIHYRCRITPAPVNGDWIVAPDDFTTCGDRACPEGTYCGSLIDQHDTHGTVNVSDLYRDTKIENLNWGFTNFDNIAYAFLTIFQVTTMEGWTNIMYIYQNSSSRYIAPLYFIFLLLVGSFFVLNLTIAIMLDKYEEISSSHGDQEMINELVDLGKEAGLPNELTEFLINHDITVKKKKQSKESWKANLKLMLYENFIYNSDVVIPNGKYHSFKFTRFFFLLVEAPLFNSFIFLCIIVNTILLALEKYPEYDDSVTNFLDICNLVFTIIFAFEVILKIIGKGMKEFSRDRFNLFDTLIVIFSVLELFISSGNSSFSALRAFRLFRIFKIFRVGNLRVLLDSITMTVGSIGNYVVLLVLFIYIYALLGMQFFAGKLKFDEDGNHDTVNGTSIRENFDNIGWSFLTIFKILIGDNWNVIMYDCMRAVGDISALYFISLVVSGSIIMLNLFLAVLLGNFDNARVYMNKKKLLSELQLCKKKGMGLKESLRFVLGKVSEQVIAYTGILGSKNNKESINKIVFKRENTISSVTSKAPGIGLENDFRSSKDSKFVKMSSLPVPPKVILPQAPSEIIPELEEDDLNNSNNSKDDLSLRALENIPYNSKDEEEEKISKKKKRNDVPANQQDGRAYDERMDQKSNKVTPKSRTDNKSAMLLRSKTSRQDMSSILHIEEEEKMKANGYKFANLSRAKDPSSKSSCKMSEIMEENPISEVDRIQKDSYFSFMKTSSLFIFNEKWEMRKFLLTLVLGSENLIELDQALKNSEEFGIKNLQKSYHIKNLQIVEGKLLTDAQHIKYSKIFESIIIGLILASSILLCVDTPLSNPDSIFFIVLKNLDYVFTFLFLVEAILKIIALGFVHNNFPGISPYILNAWNILDLFVVISSLIDFGFTVSSSGPNTEQLKSLKALRAIRALRPLRMISRNEGLKISINALISSIPAMANVLLVCILFLLIFAIMGVDFFKGAYYACEDLSNEVLQTIETKQDCIDQGGSWKNYHVNFDNTINAMFTLFQMTTTEGWMSVMNRGVDTRGIDKQPETNYHIWMIFYFVWFMVIGSLFIINLFVGVIIDNFNKIKESEEIGGKGLFITENQKKWVEIQHIMLRQSLRFKAPEPKSKCRKKAYFLVNHRYFEVFIMICILLNTLLMSMRYARMSDTYEFTLETINYVFSIIFNIEMILKMIGNGIHYFKGAWNKFDFLIVVGTDIGFMINIFIGVNISTAATVVRAFRILRIFRLMKSFGKMILDALVYIIPQITNIMSLIFLLLFIYSCLGISLFAPVMYRENYNRLSNFRNFFFSIIILLRCATGEDWNLVMNDLGSTSEFEGVKCQNAQTYDEMQRDDVLGCGSDFSIPYFTTFVLIITFIAMNLTVAAVIDGLSSARKDEGALISSENINTFIDLWSDYDPKATGWVSIDAYVFLIFELPKPIGLGSEVPTNYKQNYDIMYKARMQQNSIEALVELGEEIQNGEHLKECREILIIKDKEHNKRYFYHLKKKILLREGLWLKILKDFNIPVYDDGRVHFKDVCKRLIKNSSHNEKLDGILKRKLRKKWDSRYKNVSKQDIVSTVDKIIVARIISKWIKYKRVTTRMSQQKGISIELLNYRRSRGSIPDLIPHAKPPTGVSPNKENDESFAISDEDSSSKIVPKNMNHFEEEDNNEEMNTLDPPRKQYVDTEGRLSDRNQEEETYRLEFPEESKEEIIQECFMDKTIPNYAKYQKKVKKIAPKKEAQQFSFYSSINHKYQGEEDDDLSLEEAKEIKE